ncbi:MAG: hypothetical protein JSW47_16245, partial [Phycisphaerales bacterium]
MFLKKWLAIVTVGILLGLTGAAHAQSQNIAVSQSSDDAEESSSGTMGLTGLDLELVEEGSNQTVRIRFNDVNIPPDPPAILFLRASSSGDESAGLVSLEVALSKPWTQTVT